MNNLYITLKNNYKIEIPKWMFGIVIPDSTVNSELEIKNMFLTCCSKLLPLGRDTNKEKAEDYLIANIDTDFSEYLTENNFYICLSNQSIPGSVLKTFDQPMYNNDPYQRMKLEDVLNEHPEIKDVDYVIYLYSVLDVCLEQIHHIYKMDEGMDFPSHNILVRYYKIIEYNSKKYLIFEYE